MAEQTTIERSRVHGNGFPHPADCEQCHYENRCPACGNSQGYTAKQRMGHGIGRCTSAPDATTRAAAWRAQFKADAKQARIENWLLDRIRDTRRARPLAGSGACGFANIEEFRTFAHNEAKAAIGRELNLTQRMQLELAVRTMYSPLALLSSVLEAPHV